MSLPFPNKTPKLYHFHKEASFSPATQWTCLHSWVKEMHPGLASGRTRGEKKWGESHNERNKSCPLKILSNLLGVFGLCTTFLDCINACSEWHGARSHGGRELLSWRGVTPSELHTVVRSASQTFGLLPRGREGGNWASLHCVTDQPFGWQNSFQSKCNGLLPAVS